MKYLLALYEISATIGDMTFADSCRFARERAGLTPQTAAPLLGVTSRTVYLWEQSNHIPSLAAQEGALLILNRCAKKKSRKK